MNFLKLLRARVNFALADLSDNERRELLQQSLTEEAEAKPGYCSIWIADVYPDSVLYTAYEDGGTETYQRPYTIADDYAVTWGDATKVIVTKRIEPAPAEASEMAAFSVDLLASTGVDHGYVLRPGKVSEVGNYPDKGIGFDATDFDSAAAAFSPVEMDVEHSPSLLDGNLGKLVSVWRDGTSLFGRFAVPSWMDAIFTKDGIAPKVSLTWDKATKRITKCAWVLNPRVPDAVLMAAFSHSKTAPPEPAARKVSPMDPKVLWSKLAAFFTQEAAKTDPTEEPVVIPGAVVPPAPKTVPTPDPRVALLEAQVATMAANQIADNALAFAQKAIDGKYALPYERTNLVVQHSRAAQDDATLPIKITFSNGTANVEGSRVEALEASVFTRAKHNLLDEVVSGITPDTADNLILMRSGPASTEDEKKKQRMRTALNATEAGKKTYARMVAEGKL